MALFVLLLLGILSANIEAQISHYRRSFYKSAVGPTSHYYHHSGGFVPLTYKSDLITDESKHRPSSKYSKKPYKGYGSEEEDASSERYTSSEYSNEARHPLLIKENDSHEYTIGTHIRVQHPITVPKKLKASHPTKSTKYTTLPSYSIDSQEAHGPPEYLTSPGNKQKYTKIYEPDAFHVISPPKSTAASHLSHHSPSGTVAYDVYEPQADSYEQTDVGKKHFKAKMRERFNGVASKKQIEQYLEDQEKLLDEALKLQLLSSPKFQKLLKTADKDHFQKELEYDEEFIANAPPPFRERFPKGGPLKGSRPRRRPPTADFKRPHISKPVLSKPTRKYRQAYVIEV